MESSEALKAVLLWLGEDQVSGAQRYEEIRQKLILLFRWRGCQVAEELADETIDRTARALLKPDFSYQGDPIAYFRGVAHNIYREWLRKERRFPTESISEGYLELPVLHGGTEKSDLSLTCLEHCLNALLPTKRTLLIRYYRSDKRAKIDGRQVLAEELGIGLNALRIQVFRLRNGLRRCVENCVARGDILFAEKT
jgi:DNA-directed RNA polymerase specialized sigma24 family protein